MRISNGGLIAICLCWVGSVYASVDPMKLTPQAVVNRVLNKGDDASLIDRELEKAELPLAQADGVFDWKVTSKAGYKIDQAELLSGTGNPEEKTWTINAAIEKKTWYGTAFQLSYDRLLQDSTLSSFASGFRSSEQVRDVATLSLRQPVLGNAFGLVDRFNFEIGEMNLESAERQRKESIENLVLETLGKYWEAYVAKENLKESIGARDKYKELVDSLVKRRRLGYVQKSDLARAKAEFETQEANVKSASATYLRVIDQLFQKMNLEKTTEVEFVIPEELPPPPAKTELNVDRLRAIKTYRSLSIVAETERRATKYATLPSVDLVGSASYTGIEEKPGNAFSEMVGGTKPTYFVGIEFSTRIDSAVVRGQRRDKEARYLEAQTRLHKARKEIELMFRDIQARVYVNYAVALSSDKRLRHQEEVVKEQERSYKQGRIDTQRLIQDYNSLFKYQTLNARAVGDYHISLNELAALKDELKD